MDSILHFYGMMFTGLQVIVILIVVMFVTSVIATFVACFVYRQDIAGAKRALRKTDKNMQQACDKFVEQIEKADRLINANAYLAKIMSEVEVKIIKAKEDDVVQN